MGMPARRLIVLLALTGATTTVSIGAFPALLPELGAAAALADWQLGAVAGAFGLARMLSNVPVGLFITHHLWRALLLAPGLTLAGALLFSLALALIGFGTLPMLAVGCALFGFSMAAWMLPLGILRAVTPPAQVAWRTALYRVSVDGGMFAGPFVSGLLTVRHAGVLPGVMLVVLAAVGLALLARARLTARSR